MSFVDRAIAAITPPETDADRSKAGAKVQMAARDDLGPMSQGHLDKPEYVCGPVARHVCEEEGTSFPRRRERPEQDARTA